MPIMWLSSQKQTRNNNAQKKERTRVVYIGNFENWSVGEPEIAKCLEQEGCEVIRIQEGQPLAEVKRACEGADLLLFCKFRCGTFQEVEKFIKEIDIPTVAWLFDLYYGL